MHLNIANGRGVYAVPLVDRPDELHLASDAGCSDPVRLAVLVDSGRPHDAVDVVVVVFSIVQAFEYQRTDALTRDETVSPVVEGPTPPACR